MRLIFFYFMTVLGISACNLGQTGPTTEKTLDCYIRVLEAEENILAQATMKAGPPGSAGVPVEVKEGMRYQGSPMSILPNTGLTYVKQFPGKYVPEHIFSWDDPEKGRLSFVINVNNFSNFSFATPTLSTSKPARMTWQGNGLERGEALTLIWENAKDNLTVPMDLIVQGQNPQIDFPAGKMKELSPGTWTLYVVRKKLYKADVGGVAAQAVAEFYSKTIALTITE